MVDKLLSLFDGRSRSCRVVFVKVSKESTLCEIEKHRGDGEAKPLLKFIVILFQVKTQNGNIRASILIGIIHKYFLPSLAERLHPQTLIQ